MVPGQIAFGQNSLSAGTPTITGGIFSIAALSLGEFETCILERFAEVIQFGKVDMTSSAARAVLPGKCRNCVTSARQQKGKHKQKDPNP
jgi:hypothetical protein